MLDYNFYVSNGFFIKENIISSSECENLIDDMIHVTQQYADYYNIEYNNQLTKEELLYDMLKNLYQMNPDIYWSFVKQSGTYSKLYNLGKLFYNENIKQILEELKITNISIPVSLQINMYCDFATNSEYRDGKLGLDAHQDWPQTRGSLNNIICWIPLTDCNDDKCPILAVKGSHLEGFLDGTTNSHNIIVDKYSDTDYEPILLNKGSCVCFNGWLVHKTGSFYNNEHIRIAIALRFNDNNDNYFISTGYQTAYSIIMNRDKYQTKVPYKDIIVNKFTGDSITHYLDLYNKRKFWYNNEGVYIENIFERLMKLQRFIRCDDLSKEIYEQLYVLKYMNRDAKVLELGGNIGRVSLVMASVLHDDSNLVVIEPFKKVATINIHHKETNCFNYNVETKILGTEPLYLVNHSWETMANRVSKENIDNRCELIEHITFEELQEKYNIVFDTLVVDCEGAFYKILKDFPNMLENIHTILIENDFDTLEEYQFVYDVFIQNGFNVIETIQSYPIGENYYNKKRYYQAFKK